MKDVENYLILQYMTLDIMSLRKRNAMVGKQVKQVFVLQLNHYFG